MKKKSLLFLILSFLCVGLVSGCGEEKFSITTEVEDSEAGYMTGGGSYVKGSTVNLRVYVNEGCTLNGVNFTKKDSSITEKVSGIENAPDGSYKYYDFAITDDTIGNYKASFDCSKTNTTNKGSSTAKNRVKFYIVKMDGTSQKDSDPFGLRTDASSSEVPYVEVANNALIGEIKNSSGTVITTNIRNVPKYQNQKFTWYKCNSFENYNTPVEKDKFDPLTMKISTNTNLCGFGTEKNNIEEVEEGIKSFVNNSNGMVITSGNNGAHIKNLFNRLTADSKNKTYIKVFTNGKNEKIKGLYYAGTYYEYTEVKDKDGNVTSSKITSLEIMKENSNKEYVNVAGIELKNIPDLYKFIQLMDLNVTSAVKDSTNSEGTVYKVNDGEYFITIDAGGQIVKYKDSNNDTYSIEYVTSFQETSVAKPKDTYIIQLSSNNETLNKQLSAINQNYDTAIKISQGYGETIQKQLAKSVGLQEKLKIYSYTWKVLDDGGVCRKDAKSIAEAPEYIEGTLKLCAYVPENSMSIIEMNDYLNKIQSFDSNIKISYLGNDHIIKTYTNKNFDSTDEIDSITLKLFGDLKNISNTFSSFSCNDSADIYVINVGATSLTIKFSDAASENKIIETIDYRAEDGMKYTYEFSNFVFK